MEDEERAWLVVAALWRGAVAGVLGRSGGDDAMPDHPAIQGFRMKAIVTEGFWGASKAAGIDSFHETAWSSATVRSDLGAVEMSATDETFAWSWEATDGRGASERGVFLTGSCPAGLRYALATLGHRDSVRVERTIREG